MSNAEPTDAAGVRERERLFSVIEDAQAEHDQEFVAEGMRVGSDTEWITNAILAAGFGDVAQAKAEALEDAAIGIVLTPVAEWKRHGNRGIRENGEADASAWLDARAAAIRALADAPKAQQ